MDIKFLTKIIEDAADIESVTYSFIKTDSTYDVVLSKAVIDRYIKNRVKRFTIHDRIFKECTCIEIIIKYADDSTKTICYSNINDLVYTVPGAAASFNPTIKRNASSPFEDTPENRDMIINIIDGLHNDVEENAQDVARGTKNLIYFTVFGDDYLELLQQQLLSIHQTTPVKEFDVLFICTPQMANKINALPVIVHFNAHYMTVARPNDGIEASKNKCRVFNWTNINEYNKVLFLDCDILSIKNINDIFDKITQTNKLYTVYNTSVTFATHNSYTHGVTAATSEQLAVYESHNQNPFNAGQFAFVNSEKMQQYFDNVIWFMENWCGPYFFEQVFMNQYFCRNLMTITNVIQNDFALIIIPNNRDIKKLHNDDNVFIHFAGPPLRADIKKEFITNYRNAYL